MNADGKTLTLTIINNSSHTLSYHAVKGENQGNIYYVEPSKIAPHETAILTGIITKDADLAGELYFLDELNRDNMLLILDPRAFYTAKAIFNLNNPYYVTKILHTTFSKSGKARDLWVTEAKIRIDDNPNFA